MARDAEVSYELDELDHKIIASLKADGRATNQKIARTLKIAPATVSARIRRLEELNAMRVVAVTDFSALGYNVLLAVGIEVQGRPAQDVAEELAKLPEVFAVHLVTGARDIEILVDHHGLGDQDHFGLAAPGSELYHDKRHIFGESIQCRPVSAGGAFHH